VIYCGTGCWTRKANPAKDFGGSVYILQSEGFMDLILVLIFMMVFWLPAMLVSAVVISLVKWLEARKREEPHEVYFEPLDEEGE
jgi:hypothetical protein